MPVWPCREPRAAGRTQGWGHGGAGRPSLGPSRGTRVGGGVWDPPAVLLTLRRCACPARQPRTPLEQEIFGLLHQTQQPITDPLLAPEEAAALQAMSLEEVSAAPSARPGSRGHVPGTCPSSGGRVSGDHPGAGGLVPGAHPHSCSRQARQRRAELQRARVLQSFYEAKARREKKIKSKK